jgi:5-methylcytosine-specific restriction endonuclease McrA
MSKKQIRQRFRSDVFERDNYTCQVCGKKREETDLNAHHITDRSHMPFGGYVKENGITVCEEDCHMDCELYHISAGTEWKEGLHPDDLYNKIGSSQKQAIEADYKQNS